MEIYNNVRASLLDATVVLPASHERTDRPVFASLRSGLPTGLPMFGAGMTCSPWQRPNTDAAAAVHTAAVRTYGLPTIKRTAVAGVRPGLRSTSPPV